MLFSGPSLKETVPEDRELLAEIATLLGQVIETANATLPDKVLDHFTFNCHSVCRALQCVFGKEKVAVVDGSYLGIDIGTETKQVDFKLNDHSWLTTPSGAIIDPYPTGIIGIISLCPLLVVNTGRYRVFGGSRYVPDPTIALKVGNRVTWRKSQLMAKLMMKCRGRQP